MYKKTKEPVEILAFLKISLCKQAFTFPFSTLNRLQRLSCTSFSNLFQLAYLSQSSPSDLAQQTCLTNLQLPLQLESNVRGHSNIQCNELIKCCLLSVD